MAIPPLQITFGVEFEAVFAFHETLLQQHLNRIGDASQIIKSIPEGARIKLNRAPQRHLKTHHTYNSWALTGPTYYPYGDEELLFQDTADEHRREFGYRGYGNEVLYIAKSILGEGVAIHDSYRHKRSDFSTWHLVNDTTLLGLERRVLKSALQEHDIWDFSSWDSFGIELVSRVLPYDSPSSFAEINNFLARLTGQQWFSLHKALVSSHCGMHVHIGLPIPADQPMRASSPVFRLETLQWLALLCVVYENVISSLHPSERREGSAAAMADISSNRGNFYVEPGFEEGDERGPTSLEDLMKLPPLAASPVDEGGSEAESFDIQSAHSFIFAPGQTLQGLVEMMNPNGRNHMVNWTYLTRTDGRARTVEFRQHEGCLDSTGVRWWVTFCGALLLLADDVAAGRKSGEWIIGKGEKALDDLFEHMGIEEEGREYFRERKQRFQNL